MTVGGTGDVLAGLTGALFARCNSPLEAAASGAFINGAAGDLAFKEFGYGLLATDVIDLYSWGDEIMKFSHIEDGRAKMVDISNKEDISRRAIASGEIQLKPETIEAIKNKEIGRVQCLKQHGSLQLWQ